MFIDFFHENLTKYIEYRNKDIVEVNLNKNYYRKL